MSQTFSISETGLKLIKAFEGYRPVDRELVSGQRIVGYGHRLYSEDAVMMNKGEAETTLRSDLEPFEEMINSQVHAPITQSQFDALCSFAYNIGPKAFLKSDTLRALNNGRPLDAANGLDVWRKSEIAGKTYVVDALMRRRTAEKALFLLTERDLSAGREDLPPVKDTTIMGLSTEDALPVFTEDDANGIVAAAPYTAKTAPMRRREDGLAGALQLSELDIIEESDLKEMVSKELSEEIDSPAVEEALETQDLEAPALLKEDSDAAVAEVAADKAVETTRTSPIAAAATDIVARLDALIEDTGTQFEDRDEEWPESLISAEVPETAHITDVVDTNVIDLNTRGARASKEDISEAISETAKKPSSLDEPTDTDVVAVIDELAQDDAFRAKPDSAAKYIETYTPDTPADKAKGNMGAGLSIPIVLGLILSGTSAGAMIRGSVALLGEWGPIITFTGFVIGIGLALTGVYAMLRINSRN